MMKKAKCYNCGKVLKFTQGIAGPSEFVQEHGFLDFITHRRDLKKKVNLYIDLITNQPLRKEEEPVS